MRQCPHRLVRGTGANGERDVSAAMRLPWSRRRKISAQADEAAVQIRPLSACCAEVLSEERLSRGLLPESNMFLLKLQTTCVPDTSLGGSLALTSWSTLTKHAEAGSDGAPNS